jgi:2-desacetyl-2-hydroxyethyl bacteriochlorophyllide A dehydrogenase
MLPSEALPPGSVMGHEFAGTVEAVGAGVDDVQNGRRVCVFPFRPVDHHDLEVAMTTGVGLGALPGAYAEAVVVDEDMLWPLPEGFGADHGALVEPLSVALHALNVAEVEASDSCAVIGAGPIGAVTALALKARGVERLAAIERNERRAGRLRDLGVDAVPLEGAHEAVVERLGGPPRIVFECAGSPAAPGLAIELVAPSGRVVLLGVLEEPVQISQLLLMLKEAEIRSSFAYRPRDFDEAIELLATGKVAADSLVTAREPLERAQDMFDELTRPGTDHLKVILEP